MRSGSVSCSGGSGRSRQPSFGIHVFCLLYQAAAFHHPRQGHDLANDYRHGRRRDHESRQPDKFHPGETGAETGAPASDNRCEKKGVRTC